MKKRQVYVFFVAILICSFGCENTEKDRFTFYGNVAGNTLGRDAIASYGMESAEVLPDVELVFDRGDKVFYSESDDLGNFRLDNIPYGTYNITVSKDGFSTQTLLGFQLYFADTTINFDFCLSKHSQVTKFESVVLENYDGGVWIDLLCDGREDDKEVFIVFFSKSEEVSYSNFEGDYYIIYWEKDSPYDYLRNLTLEKNTHYAIYPVCSFTRWVYVDGSIYSFNGFDSWIEPNSKTAFPVEFNTDVFYKGTFIENPY